MHERSRRTSILGLLVALALGCKATPREAQTDETAGRVAPIGSLVPTGSMSAPRAAHSATRLADGTVLIVGGCTTGTCEPGPETGTAESYDPLGGRFRITAPTVAPRVGHAAALLDDGRLLVAGGWVGGQPAASAEIYDPSRGAFALLSSTLHEARGGPTATRLADGRILLAGGQSESHMLASCEIYDPQTATFRTAASMLTPRIAHTATLLADGRVLITGGSTRSGRVTDGAELYDPNRDVFVAAGRMSVPRHKHAAVGLADGRVLVVGGSDERDSAGRYASAEIYDPSVDRFTPTGSMQSPRFKLAEIALLPDGTVLVAGGSRSVEVFDPATGTFRTARGDLGAEWAFITATPLANGQVLLAGGYDERIRISRAAWLYQPAAAGAAP